MSPTDTMKEALHARILVAWRDEGGNVDAALPGSTSTERLLERLKQIGEAPETSHREEVDAIARELGVRRNEDVIRHNKRRIAEKIAACREVVTAS